MDVSKSDSFNTIKPTMKFLKKKDLINFQNKNCPEQECMMKVEACRTLIERVQLLYMLNKNCPRQKDNKLY